MRRVTVSIAVVTMVAALGLVTAAPGFAATPTPRWVSHVKNFPGGLSNSVRFTLDPAVRRAQALLGPNPPMRAARSGLNNVQMNDDSFPQMPQNEESVAYSLDDPMVAVAGGERLRERRRRRHAHVRWRQTWKSTRVDTGVPAHQRRLQWRRSFRRLQPS